MQQTKDNKSNIPIREDKPNYNHLLRGKRFRGFVVAAALTTGAMGLTGCMINLPPNIGQQSQSHVEPEGVYEGTVKSSSTVRITSDIDNNGVMMYANGYYPEWKGWKGTGFYSFPAYDNRKTGYVISPSNLDNWAIKITGEEAANLQAIIERNILNGTSQEIPTVDVEIVNGSRFGYIINNEGEVRSEGLTETVLGKVITVKVGNRLIAVAQSFSTVRFIPKEKVELFLSNNGVANVDPVY